MLNRTHGYNSQFIGGKPFSVFLQDVKNVASGFGKDRVVFADQKSSYEQAVSIVAALLKKKTVIPLCEQYGEARSKRIREKVFQSKLPRSVATVLFTSGTGGNPKGVMLSRRALLNNIAAIRGYMGACHRRILIIRPLMHSAVLTGELLYAIKFGWDIYFWEKSFQPAEIASFITKNQIDIVGMTPTLLKFFVRLGYGLSLKEIVLSGERLTKEDAILFADIYPSCKFYSVYGLTENSPRVSALCPNEFLTYAGSVGKPIRGVKLRLVDGELWLKSNCLMKGYLGDSVGTKEKFYKGWLKTGDRASIDQSGNLYILGRQDSMIIRSGMNIYPEEIELPMRRFDGIEDCIAYAINDRKVGTKIALDYVGDADEQQVAEFAIKQLPSYLVPNQYRRRTSLKRTISGKIRRNH